MKYTFYAIKYKMFCLQTFHRTSVRPYSMTKMAWQYENLFQHVNMITQTIGNIDEQTTSESDVS